jgi:hypothetical protein
MALTSALINDDPAVTEAFTSTGNNAITTIIVCNTATYNPASPLTGLTYLSLWAVKSGASHGDVNLIVNALPVPAGETVTFDQEKMVLENGDKIVAYCPPPANLTITISTLPV